MSAPYPMFRPYVSSSNANTSWKNVEGPRGKSSPLNFVSCIFVLALHALPGTKRKSVPCYPRVAWHDFGLSKVLRSIASLAHSCSLSLDSRHQ